MFPRYDSSRYLPYGCRYGYGPGCGYGYGPGYGYGYGGFGYNPYYSFIPPSPLPYYLPPAPITPLQLSYLTNYNY